jgi:hypothetical protein
MSLAKGRSSVVVGRGHEADVRINDISVSRFHAVIRWINAAANGGKKQQIVIEDRGSKFGSLIAVRGPIPLELGVPLSIQSGRTITTITVKKPNLFTNLLCFRPTSNQVSAQLNAAAQAANPILLSESGPTVDLKQVLSNPMPQQNESMSSTDTRRQLMARASVASTALRRASEALSMIQFDDDENRVDSLSPHNN